MAIKRELDSVMTKEQFDVLMCFASKYEISLRGIENWTEEQAFNKINFLKKQVKQGALKLRKKPYEDGYLSHTFEHKYPEIYNVIAKQQESGARNDLSGNTDSHETKGCETCMRMKSGECFGQNSEVCELYKHSPSVSKEVIETWPKYGDATAFKLGKRRF